MSEQKKLTYADIRHMTVEQKLEAVKDLSDEEFDALLAERDGKQESEQEAK